MDGDPTPLTGALANEDKVRGIDFLPPVDRSLVFPGRPLSGRPSVSHTRAQVIQARTPARDGDRQRSPEPGLYQPPHVRAKRCLGGKLIESRQVSKPGAVECASGQGVNLVRHL